MNIRIKNIVLLSISILIANTLYAENFSRANPASVHCKRYGGQLEFRQTEKGTQGICHFSDGSQCDEWAFYKRQCKIGKRWVYHCDEDLSFTMNYLTRQRALVEFGSQEVKLKQIESGSGIRYSGDDITFSGKGLDGNLIMEDGEAYGENCHVPKTNNSTK